MNRVQRLKLVVAELRARKMAAEAVPLAVAELGRAGFRVGSTWEDGLAVDEAPGLSAKLEELRGRGIDPGLVCILRDVANEPAGSAPSGREGVTDPNADKERRNA